MIKMDKKILAVVNPTAGAGKTLKIWPKKSKLFKQEFSNFREKYTNQPGDAVEIAKKAVEENYDYIIAVGGDGTVNEIINGMLKVSTNFVKTKLLIYPLGTGSDLSRVLNLPDQDKGFLELIYRGKSRNISAVEAKFINHEKKEKRYFIF
jgi:diacylglycerol kinase family enzyme